MYRKSYCTSSGVGNDIGIGGGEDVTKMLTLKAPNTTAADGIHKYISLFFRENKT